MLDVSFNGALFSADAPLNVDVGHQCELTGKSAEKVVFSARTARVSYVLGTLVGVEFLGCDESLMNALHRLVDMNLGTPQLLTRDIPALLKAAQSS